MPVTAAGKRLLANRRSVRPQFRLIDVETDEIIIENNSVAPLSIDLGNAHMDWRCDFTEGPRFLSSNRLRSSWLSRLLRR